MPFEGVGFVELVGTERGNAGLVAAISEGDEVDGYVEE